ncbi:MAG: Crp/Fnr family transcriptional regulator [Hyphomicrobiaceae bacterium]|nr:Crp/Fnr family transcriptional regulator [Hyphomicrobiaceae bacterium]
MQAKRRVERPQSNLLRALSEDDYGLIAPYLCHETRSAGDLLYQPGDNVANVYFPCGPSLISYHVTNSDGRDVETVLVGREGAVGGIVSLGFLPAYCMIVVKVEGPYVRVPVTSVQAAKDHSPSFKNLFARYADCLMAQMFQATACNAIHSIEQRTAKWILAALDRTGTDKVPLTHEELAAMMGVGRSYTSRVLQGFKRDGTIETRRGQLVIKDHRAMQKRSCQCNEMVKAHFEMVLRNIYPDESSH